MAIFSPSETFLERESAHVASTPLLAPATTQPAADPPAELVPATIDVEFWREDDGSWAAHVPMLGVTAIADTQAELYAETADVVSEFWDILNAKFDTLAPHLRELLELRELPLAFTPRA
jgi:hypothetical protein